MRGAALLVVVTLWLGCGSEDGAPVDAHIAAPDAAGCGPGISPSDCARCGPLPDNYAACPDPWSRCLSWPVPPECSAICYWSYCRMCDGSGEWKLQSYHCPLPPADAGLPDAAQTDGG